MNEQKMRRERGAAVTGLVLALFLFIMMIGFFTFDTCRLQMAQRELIATCDSAALAGTAMLTSQDISNDNASMSKLITAQQNAAGYARNMFQAGNLLGQSLVNAQIVTTLAATQGPLGNAGDARVMIALADPQNNYAPVLPVAPQAANGRAVMVYAGYTYAPVFMGMVGIQKVGLNAQSGGGLPQVDAVMVFDYSGSMDDATVVTFVNRVWNPSVPAAGGSASAGLNEMSSGLPVPNKGQVFYYEVPSANAGSNRLSDYIIHNYSNNPNGLQVNVLPPMNLDLVDNTDSQATPHFKFDNNMRCNAIPFQSAPFSCVPALDAHYKADYGTPPGNCTLQPSFSGSKIGGYGQFWDSMPSITTSPTTATKLAYNPQDNSMLQGPHKWVDPGYHTYNPNSTSDVQTYRYMTDMVVNIADPGAFPYVQPLDGPTPFVGFTFTFPSDEPDTTIKGQTFSFENIGVLVEAARGNLDTDAGGNPTYFQQALLDRGSQYVLVPSGTTQTTGMTTAHVKKGYQLAYQRLAMLFSQPIATAVDGADGGFFQKINSLCDCRFGFVGFSNRDGAGGAGAYTFDTCGTAHNLTGYDSYFVSTRYSSFQIKHMDRGLPTNDPSRTDDPSNPSENNTSLPSGSGFRTPRHTLSKPESQAVAMESITGGRRSTTLGSNSAAWSAFDNNSDANGLDNGRPIDHTDCGEAMTAAYNMFLDSPNYNLNNLSECRPAGKHAIVFFTDGIPTAGAGEDTEAQSDADLCKAKGIAVFTIGLDVTNNPVLQSGQQSFLGMSSTGLAGRAKNGGRFTGCASAQTVKNAFNAVARRLTQSQR